jgi:hypothetical protein
MPKTVELTDAMLAEALKASIIKSDTPETIKKGKKTIQVNRYSFSGLYLSLTKKGVTAKASSVRQRVYSINKKLADAGKDQVWLAKRPAGKGRPSAEFDADLFLV